MAAGKQKEMVRKRPASRYNLCRKMGGTRDYLVSRLDKLREINQTQKDKHHIFSLI
jgi:hypothetical protein